MLTSIPHRAMKKTLVDCRCLATIFVITFQSFSVSRDLTCFADTVISWPSVSVSEMTRKPTSKTRCRTGTSSER